MAKLDKFKKPSAIEIRELLKSMPGWIVDKDRLEKEYRFRDFIEATVFLNKIINPIEENQNYPQVSIAYNRVKVSLFTTTVGAITVMDLAMAKEFDQLAG